MIARNLKRQQRRSTATERLSGWVKPRKGMLRNKTKKPRRRRNLKEKSERESVLRKEDLELRRQKGAESKGGYDENAGITTAAADSGYALFSCKRPK